MASPPLRRQAEVAIRDGVDYLVEGQSPEGFWLDFALRAGASEAWTTAWVGWCLAGCASSPQVRRALADATTAVLGAATSDGWGYSRATGADADSTAWAVNFLAARGYAGRAVAAELLPRYISTRGGVRTFLDPLTGTWSDPQPDVGAMVGFALLNTAARPDLVQRIRFTLMDCSAADGTWPSFWWASRTYATVWAALFAQRTGGLSRSHIACLRDFAAGPSLGDSPLERALGLLLLTELCPEPNPAAGLVADLLDEQCPRGAWPSSVLLLVPPRDEGEPSHPVGPHPDVNAFVTTAMACLALHRWLLRTGSHRFTGTRADGIRWRGDLADSRD